VLLKAAPATKNCNQTCQRKKQLYFPLERIHCKEKVHLITGLKKYVGISMSSTAKFQQNECILQILVKAKMQ
jgi:hypothetical protein